MGNLRRVKYTLASKVITCWFHEFVGGDSGVLKAVIEMDDGKVQAVNVELIEFLEPPAGRLMNDDGSELSMSREVRRRLKKLGETVQVQLTNGSPSKNVEVLQHVLSKIDSICLERDSIIPNRA